MGILFLVLLVILIELLQILMSKYKIVKWIIPIISFIISINILLGIIVFELNETVILEPAMPNMIHIFLFIITNIPTVIFSITNYVMNSKKNTDKNFYKNIKLSIIIILIILTILSIYMLMQYEKPVKRTNFNNSQNIIDINSI